MDRDTIIRLAREAGLWEMLEGYANEYVCGNAEEDCLPDLERFAALVAKAERHRIYEMLIKMHTQEERHNYYMFIANIIKESA